MEPNGSDCGPTNSRQRPSSKFFKIILHSSIHEKKLRIPEKFVRKHGDELSAVSILTVPTGQVSHVALEKTDKMIWFCDGWQQFMDHHSISWGYFLVFEYKGNSSFDVLIFDLTATEIQYPCSIHDNGQQCQLSDDEEEIEDDDSVEILGSSGFVGSSALNKKGKSAALFVTKNVENLQAQALPVRDQDFNLLNENELKDKRERMDLEDRHPTKRENSSQVATQKNRGTSKYSQTTNQRTVSNGEESLVKQEWCEEMLGINTRSITCLTRGPVINQARERAINAATMFKPENPFHMSILRSYNVNPPCLLNIPSEFVTKMKYLLGIPDRVMVKLQLCDGREWHVRFIQETGRAKLSKGWKKFVKENNLVEGDICVFELIKVKDFVLKVSIFRTMAGYTGQANQPLK